LSVNDLFHTVGLPPGQRETAIRQPLALQVPGTKRLTKPAHNGKGSGVALGRALIAALTGEQGTAILRSLEHSKVKLLVPRLLKWFAAHARDLPWRRTQDPYGVYVSEIMLQQTQVKTVIPYWERWMRELPTLEAAATAAPGKIHKLWEGLGYYHRVRNLQKAAQTIRRDHGGVFPERFAEVLALPGIGRYTAGAICSIAFNQPTPILDGNVIRVLTRIFGISEDPKEKQTNARLWELAEALVQTAKRRARSCSALNQALMELGALSCTPRQPQCDLCPAKTLCIAHREGRTEELPNVGKRPAASARRFLAFVVEHDGKWLVRQRPAHTVNAHLWEFPNREVTGAAEAAATVAKMELGFTPKKLAPLGTVKHSITRYRITLEAYIIPVAKQPAGLVGSWQTVAELRALAFTAAHKKLASLAGQRILAD
jgi:A/G-specific adenine glycosylase